MAFYFTTLKDGEKSFHAVLPGDNDSEVKRIVSELPGNCVLKTSHVLGPAVNEFFDRTYCEQSVRLRMQYFRKTMYALAAEGKKIIDDYACKISPFRSPNDCIFNAGLSNCDEPEELQNNACDGTEVRMSSSMLSNQVIRAVTNGMRNRIYETSDYSFYFVSARHRKGHIVDFLVQANEEAFVNEAVHKYGAPLEKLFQHRLSPDVQAFCTMMQFMRGVPDNVKPMPYADIDEANEETFSGKSYRSLLGSLRAEGKRIYAMHKDVYPPRPPEAPLIEDLPTAWKKSAKALEGKKPITFAYEELLEVALDVLGSGHV